MAQHPTTGSKSSPKNKAPAGSSGKVPLDLTISTGTNSDFSIHSNFSDLKLPTSAVINNVSITAQHNFEYSKQLTKSDELKLTDAISEKVTATPGTKGLKFAQSTKQTQSASFKHTLEDGTTGTLTVAPNMTTFVVSKKFSSGIDVTTAFSDSAGAEAIKLGLSTQPLFDGPSISATLNEGLAGKSGKATDTLMIHVSWSF